MLRRDHTTAWLLVVMGIACHPVDKRGAPFQQSRTQVGAGTYTLHVCRVVCDAAHPRNEIRSGWMVLDTTAVDIAVFADSIQRALKDAYMFMRHDGTANGCFQVRTTRPEVESYAGITPGSLLHWQRAAGGDSVSFALYRSPDAGYEVSVHPTPTGFLGQGQSWGAGAAEVDYPEDIVVGDYVGPPQLERCAEAGLAFNAWVRGLR